MVGFSRKTGACVSEDARKRIARLKPYPTLDMWRNPVTRGFARKLQNEEWQRTLAELDFDYRSTATNLGGINGVGFETAGSRPDQPVILFVHGGGFVAGGPEICAASLLPSCYLSGADGIGLSYSLLPEAIFPIQIDELSNFYEALCTEHPQKRVVLLAESTGAAIALAALMAWRDQGQPLPAGAVFLSPFIDGTGASDTQISLDGRDPLIKSMRGNYVRNLFRFYAPDTPLDDPAVSPIYGDFTGLPPLLVQAGSREVMLGDAARLSQAARRAGVDTCLQVFDGMVHRFHAFWSLSETRDAHQDIADFIATLD